MSNYVNRIVGLEYVDAADLLPHPDNWRVHPAAQADALRGVLAEVGIAGALMAYNSVRYNHPRVVIDGRLRQDTAPQKWPVLMLDVDDREADYILATHDPLAVMAETDVAALEALLGVVQSGEAAVQTMLAEMAQNAGIVPPEVEFPEYDEAAADEVEYHTCPNCGHQWPK